MSCYENGNGECDGIEIGSETTLVWCCLSVKESMNESGHIQTQSSPDRVSPEMDSHGLSGTHTCRLT